MNTTWIDFKELRARLRFADVLQSHNVELKVRGERASGFCPLPTHQGHRNSPSFSADLAKGIWQCFGCGAKGNVIDFEAYMRGFDPASREGIRQAALGLHERFGLIATPASMLPKQRGQPNGKPRSTAAEAKEEAGETEKDGGQSEKNGTERVAARPVLVNAPLDFALKGLLPDHPYLKGRGFTQETIVHFGLGYCSKGLMQGRIAIPLHDSHGRLVGYAGRLADEGDVPEDKPKYLFPSTREREGKTYEFRKSLLLYNAFQVTGPVDDLIVVEGFASVWHLWACGFPDTVAIMGSSCSPEQAQMIVKLVAPEGRIWVFTDADKAGERCAEELFFDLTPHRSCRWVKLREGQPTDYSAQQLRSLLCPNSVRDALRKGGGS